MNCFVRGSVEAVFAVFTDEENSAGRISGIKKIELLTPSPIGADSSFKETREMFGREASEDFTITRFERPAGYSLVCNSCGLEMTTTFRFSPANGEQMS